MTAKPMTRRDVAKRKEALAHDLRLAGREAALAPDAMMLSVRELSAKYGLAIRTVSLELQKLAQEGVLYTVPRVGTFVGRPHAAREDLFVALFRAPDFYRRHYAGVRIGFEERIAHLGGSSLVLDRETAQRYRAAGEMPVPAGIFDFHDLGGEPAWREQDVPHVGFGALRMDTPNADAVYFDNIDGGRQATRHLMGLGHRRIAFLGLHGAQDEPGFFLWSQERAAGWRNTLQEAGLSADGLLFQPKCTAGTDYDDQFAAARKTAARLLKNSDITAVVAVNGFAAQGFFEAMRAARRPVERWPAVVGFDTELLQRSHDAMHVVTALRLPWEDIGREAANVLWERAQGRSGEAQQRLVSMNLIPRLSCRGAWERVPGVGTLFEERSVAAI